MPRLVADGLSYEQIQELKTTDGTPNGGDGRLGIDARKVILQEEVPQLVLQPRDAQKTPRFLLLVVNRKCFWFTYWTVASLILAATAILGAATTKSDVWEGYEPSVLGKGHSDSAAACAAASDSEASCKNVGSQSGIGGSSGGGFQCVWFADEKGDGSCGLPRWCEHVRVRALVRTPSNTFSAHFYTLVALYMLLCGAADLERTWRRQPSLANNPICKVWWLSALAALANITHGFGVFWNHGCGCTQGGQYDVGGMDAAVTFNTFYCAFLLSARGDAAAHVDSPKGRWALRATTSAYVALASAVYALNLNSLTGAVFAVGIGGAVAFASLHALLHLRAPDSPRVAILGAAVLMLGCGIGSWWEEYWFQTCRWATRSPVQPHSLWHFFTAGALGLAYCYVRAMGTSSWRQALTALFLAGERDQEELPSSKSEECDSRREYLECGGEHINSGLASAELTL